MNPWYYITNIFNKKENKNMADAPTTNKSLKTELKKQREEIMSLCSRLSTLADENFMLNNDLDKLKKAVSEDINFIYERLKEIKS
tara:strand:+ start:57 stop:311 length:255 start_codon:yes stop_codon:yes gene_type:complete